jgi:hypothetical protein
MDFLSYVEADENREMGMKKRAETRMPQKLESSPRGEGSPDARRTRVVLPPVIMPQSAPLGVDPAQKYAPSVGTKSPETRNA